MRFAAERFRPSVLFCHDIRAPGGNPPATVLFPESLNGCACGTQAPAAPLARYRGQSGIRCASREPHAEQTKRLDLAKARGDETP
jgi:hypothetical protein